jgi:hypothetical protein
MIANIILSGLCSISGLKIWLQMLKTARYAKISIKSKMISFSFPILENNAINENNKKNAIIPDSNPGITQVPQNC